MSFSIRAATVRERFLETFMTTTLVLAILTGCSHSSSDEDVVVFGGLGTTDGHLSYPRAVAIEPRGSVFVADKSGRIQRFSSDGQFELAWSMPEFRAGNPVGLSVGPDGRLYIADTHYHRVLVADRDGHTLTTFGREGLGDGEFQLPTAVTFDAQGRIYVSEYHLNDRITQWSRDGQFIKVVAGGEVAGRPLRRPAGIEVDSQQTLWVADACNHRILHLSLDGQVLGHFGEFGEGLGQLKYPYDICLTPQDTLLVCEYGNNRLQWFTKEGKSLRIRGRAGRGRGELFAPWGAVVDPDGRVYVADALNHRIQILNP